jgi:hypothetical protein
MHASARKVNRKKPDSQEHDRHYIDVAEHVSGGVRVFQPQAGRRRASPIEPQDVMAPRADDRMADRDPNKHR